MKLLGKFLFVRIAKPSDKARVKMLIEGWFKEHGRKVIAGRLEKCLAQMQTTGIPRPAVRFQTAGSVRPGLEEVAGETGNGDAVGVSLRARGASTHPLGFPLQPVAYEDIRRAVRIP